MLIACEWNHREKKIKPAMTTAPMSVFDDISVPRMFILVIGV